MRIIAGKYGRRQLLVPKSRNIRPTSDKIRGAIFNALEAQNAIHSANILDAFCGTGALGLEALSRGANFCTFMDKDKNALNLAKDNIQILGSAAESEAVLSDATKCNFRGKSYDLIFLDPPYHKDLIELTLIEILKQSALSSTGLIICESEKGSHAVHKGPHAKHFELISEKIYGDTKVEILKSTRTVEDFT
ncbi:MAG: 16S rRNA (guanine(966)-N(2))-methyltransferase RsmD [Micavibrio sp.]|nr:16S rRNA (guanine(966)-N(2))-methyltransferase RsmD [Micavibrio sp.]